MANPKLSKDLNDRAGTKRLRAGANRELKRVFKRASQVIYKQALDMIQPVGVETNNAVAAASAPTKTYVYEMDPIKLAGVNSWLQNVLYYEMLGNPQGVWQQEWFMNQYFSMAFESGVTLSLTDAQRIATPAIVGPEIAGMMRGIQVSTVLADPAMVRRLGNVYARSFNDMRGMSDTIRSALSGEITRGMANGKSPRWIARRLREQTNMELYRAERISRTEINRSYTDAYMDEQNDLNNTVYKGERHKMALMHLSALIPGRTRYRHAHRHGVVTTKAKQEAWWSEGSNRINCLCSVASVLVNKKTGEPVNSDFVQEVKEQKEGFVN